MTLYTMRKDLSTVFIPIYITLFVIFYCYPKFLPSFLQTLHNPHPSKKVAPNGAY